MQTLNEKCRQLWDDMPELKLKYAMMSAVLFLLVSSPQMYKLTNSIINTSVNGCPTDLGLLVHAFVFMLLEFGLMNLPKDL